MADLQVAGTVTAIIPVYNRCAYLGEALGSVFGQTRPVDEVIVVDDCSTTSVADYLATTPYANHVRLLRTDHNRKVAGARNWGWRHACCEFVAFLDSDDLWEIQKTELQWQYLRAHPEVSGVFGAMTAFFPDGTTEPWAHDRPPHITVAAALVDSNISVQALMMRRTALERIGGFDERFGILDDQDIAIRLALAGLRIDFLSDPPVTRLRRNSENFSSNFYRYFQEDLMINRIYCELLDQTYGPGSWRVHLGRVLKRYGRRVRHMGLPTRVAARLLSLSAPRSSMPSNTA